METIFINMKPKDTNTTIVYINKSKIVYKWKGPLKLILRKVDIIDKAGIYYQKTVVKLE